MTIVLVRKFAQPARFAGVGRPGRACGGTFVQFRGRMAELVNTAVLASKCGGASMWTWIGWGIAAVIALLAVAWCWRAAWRIRVGRSFLRERQLALQGFVPALRPREDNQALAQAFGEKFLIRVPLFLDGPSLERCRQEALDNMPRLVRNFIPTHKQGGTISYETLHHHAPSCVALYHSPEMLGWVSSIVGEKVRPAGDHDQSACSILYYTQPGDFINWHYDHNFYGGRQFTILIVLADRNEQGGRSSSTLVRKHADGREEVVDAVENELVLFEGTRVLHKVNPAASGDTRIVLSMTLNTDPRIGLFWELARRVKDISFHGLRALWD